MTPSLALLHVSLAALASLFAVPVFAQADRYSYLGLSRFAIFARAGAQYATTQAFFSGSGAIGVPGPNARRRDTNHKLGVGLQYAVSPWFILRAEAERYRVNDALDHHGHVNVALLNLVPVRPLAGTGAACFCPTGLRGADARTGAGDGAGTGGANGHGGGRVQPDRQTRRLQSQPPQRATHRLLAT